MALIVTWRCFLGLLGLFGIVGIKLPMNQNANYRVRFGGLLGVFYKIIKVLCVL